MPRRTSPGCAEEEEAQETCNEGNEGEEGKRNMLRKQKDAKKAKADAKADAKPKAPPRYLQATEATEIREREIDEEYNEDHDDSPTSPALSASKKFQNAARASSQKRLKLAEAIAETPAGAEPAPSLLLPIATMLGWMRFGASPAAAADCSCRCSSSCAQRASSCSRSF